MEAALHAIESESTEEGSPPPGLGVTGAATGTVGGVDEATLQKSSALISALMSGNSGTTTLSMALRGISMVFSSIGSNVLIVSGIWGTCLAYNEVTLSYVH